MDLEEGLGGELSPPPPNIQCNLKRWNSQDLSKESQEAKKTKPNKHALNVNTKLQNLSPTSLIDDDITMDEDGLTPGAASPTMQSGNSQTESKVQSSTQVTINKGNNDNNKNDTIKYPQYSDKSHCGPYKVFVENKNIVTDNNERKVALPAIEVAQKLIPIYNDNIEVIEPVGYNKVRVVFKNKRDANHLINHPILSESNLISYIPNSLVSKKNHY